MANTQGNLASWKKISLGLVVANIFLLLYTFSVTLAWFIQRQNFVPKEHSPLTCFSSEDRSKEKCFTNLDGNLCCSNDTLSGYVQNVAKKRYEEQISLENIGQHCIYPAGNMTKTAGRVVGLDRDKAPAKILQWRQNSKGGFFNDVKYLSGRFIILKTGYYFIYSQVTFIEHSETSRDTLSHFIYRQTPLVKEKLIESARSHCRLQTGESDSSRFLGSVFLVREGEEIFVEVTEPTKISNAEYANFFGLHII